MQTDGVSSTLELRHTAVPEPGPQQLLVRMHAAGEQLAQAKAAMEINQHLGKLVLAMRQDAGVKPE